MFCPKCGSQLPDNASFCAKCGAQVQMTTQAVQSASVAAQSIPVPASKRGPSGKLIRAAVAVVAAVVVVAAGFATNWFGIAGGRDADEPIYVVKSETESFGSGGQLVMEYEHDSLGNCTVVRESDSNPIKLFGDSVMIEHDENGFITDFGPYVGHQRVTLSNEFDAHGRLVSFVVSGLADTVRARYSYYGETDCVSQVEYSADRGMNAGVTMLLCYILGSQCPGCDPVFLEYIDGEDYLVTYSYTGQMTSMGSPGAMNDVAVPSRENRAGKTVDNEWTDGWRTSFTYDEHGCVVYWSNEFPGVESESCDLAYELVTSPSRAVATFGRLYS